MAGLVAGVLIGASTEYFTSDTYKPTQGLADTALTGSATIMIGGLGLGMLSTILPIVIVAVCILVAYYVSGGAASTSMGLYGIALAAVGMLATLGITLATDAYGPVADNAGGIAEMAGLEPEVRERTDALDSLGNTTAATGKGFAIGSASHAIGTAKAMELGDIEGAMSSLSIVVSGILTVLGANLFASFL